MADLESLKSDLLRLLATKEHAQALIVATQIHQLAPSDARMHEFVRTLEALADLHAENDETRPTTGSNCPFCVQIHETLFPLMREDSLQRRIFTDADLAAFLSVSPGYKRLVAFVEQLAQATQNCFPSECAESFGQAEKALLEMLSFLERGLEKFPIEERDLSGSRFGDKRFRDWLEIVRSELPREGRKWLDEESEIYLWGSFGDPTRVDYGTGHELNFLVFLLVLADRKYVEISSCLVLDVFWQYIRTARRVISHFRLEPAGSHGVWGLDDYHHLVFLFGAAQLTGPSARTRPTVAEMFQGGTGAEWLFAYALEEVRRSKSGASVSLQLSAPVLWSIGATVESWEKATLGLMRMFVGEVLGKRPVVQHLVFGSVVRWSS